MGGRDTHPFTAVGVINQASLDQVACGYVLHICIFYSLSVHLTLAGSSAEFLVEGDKDTAQV